MDSWDVETGVQKKDKLPGEAKTFVIEQGTGSRSSWVESLVAQSRRLGLTEAIAEHVSMSAYPARLHTAW